jgi:phosphonatase-like hydrolase
MVMPSLAVFDLGGTLIRDRGEVPAAFTAALERAGIAFDAAEVSGWRGASKREVIDRLVKSHGRQASAGDDVYADFSASLQTRFSAAADLALTGAAAAFAELKSAGVRIALNSGFDRGIVDLVLESVRWPAWTFDAIVCVGDVPRGRPAPFMIFRSMERTGVDDVRRVAVVGDTQLDLEAGARAGAAWRIGVLSGAHDRQTLELAPYTHIVDDCGAVPAVCLGTSVAGVEKTRGHV